MKLIKLGIKIGIVWAVANATRFLVGFGVHEALEGLNKKLTEITEAQNERKKEESAEEVSESA